MIGLHNDFHNLPLPESLTNHSYSAVPIKGYENHRIAKNYKGNPCILLSTTSHDERFKVTRQQLYNLSIIHNLYCEIYIKEKKETHQFSVIYYSGTDEDLKEHFLKVCEILIPFLGNRPSNDKIIQVVNKFIELFKVLKEPPRKTIQGLWSELFLIHQSENSIDLVKGWHTIPEEKYDFSFEKLKLEIKSSSTRSRTHFFSLEQLSAPSNCELYIVSIFVEFSTGGKNIEDLVNELETRLNSNKELIEKLNMVVYSTLGSSVNQIKSAVFDYQLAKDSIRLYNSINLPKIKSIPDNIFDVKFRSNIDSIIYSNESISTLIKRSKQRKKLT